MLSSCCFLGHAHRGCTNCLGLRLSSLDRSLRPRHYGQPGQVGEPGG